MARKIPDQFVPLDLNMPRDPAIRRAGPDAELLYIRAMIYLKQSPSDGFIPEFDLPVIAVGLKRVKDSVAALVQEDLWIKGPGGWQCRSWLKWNKSTAELTEDKEQQKLGAMLSNHNQGRHEKKPNPECPDCKKKVA